MRLRLRDPRRFGAVLWAAGDAAAHPLLAHLGIEPLSRSLNSGRLHALTRARRFLLVVADSATLGDHDYYAAFISHIDEIDAHGSAWSDDAPPL